MKLQSIPHILVKNTFRSKHYDTSVDEKFRMPSSAVGHTGNEDPLNETERGFDVLNPPQVY